MLNTLARVGQWFERHRPVSRARAGGGSASEAVAIDGSQTVTRYKLGHEDTIEMVCIEDHGTLFDIDHTVPEAPYVLLSEDTLQSRNVEDDARLGTSRCSHLIVGPGRVQLESHPSVVGSCCIVCNFFTPRSGR
jgi:hypothetical protein